MKIKIVGHVYDDKGLVEGTVELDDAEAQRLIDNKVAVVVDEVSASLPPKNPDGGNGGNGGDGGTLDIEALKKEADMLGINYAASIGAAKLAERIAKHKAGLGQ
ncbi:MAG: hypothetical protein PHE67_02635 [Campylobacterales bacterium]|nr:hypothetical protein [Campylobacterales bacterium]